MSDARYVNLKNAMEINGVDKFRDKFTAAYQVRIYRHADARDKRKLYVYASLDLYFREKREIHEIRFARSGNPIKRNCQCGFKVKALKLSLIYYRDTRCARCASSRAATVNV